MLQFNSVFRIIVKHKIINLHFFGKSLILYVVTEAAKSTVPVHNTNPYNNMYLLQSLAANPKLGDVMTSHSNSDILDFFGANFILQNCSIGMRMVGIQNYIILNM